MALERFYLNSPSFLSVFLLLFVLKTHSELYHQKKEKERCFSVFRFAHKLFLLESFAPRGVGDLKTTYFAHGESRYFYGRAFTLICCLSPGSRRSLGF